MRKPLSQTARAKLLDALLAGREINGTLFAIEVGTAGSTVAKILRDVSGALTSRRAREEAGRIRVYYRASDPKQLRIARDSMTYGGSAGHKRARLQFDSLLEAWQILPRDIDLPTLVHRLAPEDDDIFSEE